jgi:hypothetical protein
VARQPTILEQCVRRRGVHRGALTAAHVAQWAIATADLDRVPTGSEYAEFWAVSERTAWYHRAGMREVYGERWPELVEQVAQVIVKGGERSPRRVMSLRVA